MGKYSNKRFLFEYKLSKMLIYRLIPLTFRDDDSCSKLNYNSDAF